jgi:hypothetical protein
MLILNPSDDDRTEFGLIDLWLHLSPPYEMHLHCKPFAIRVNQVEFAQLHPGSQINSGAKSQMHLQNRGITGMHSIQLGIAKPAAATYS